MDDQLVADWLAKAAENLACAQSELAAGRFNAAGNRAYYAAYQAAIAALVRDDVRARGDMWDHGYVQAQFSGLLIGRRKRYPAALRSVLPPMYEIWRRADYDSATIGIGDVRWAVRSARSVVEAISSGVTM